MRLITTAFLAAATLPALAATSVPEPETIFYGKVVNVSGPQPYQMSSGSLAWKIRSGESEELEFSGSLAVVAAGDYSYRLGIPHSALALDLEIRVSPADRDRFAYRGEGGDGGLLAGLFEVGFGDFLADFGDGAGVEFFLVVSEFEVDVGVDFCG